ncbi:MAG TPA: nicotinate (nicotinamide) nucleotide adenylyltransferase, partial [Opitutales bacterium]|nr:nicotinate (nicotinamide) nucleotide adenylyltransferase [Opitutales bacterium]
IKSEPVLRIGLYGGSFDPVHNGHLTIAQTARKALLLDAVYFIPVGQSPLKEHRPHASNTDRLHMLQLAIQGLGEGYGVLDTDLNRSGPNYTLDTLALLKPRFPKAQLFWIVGEDQFSALAHWHEVDTLVREVEFIVYKRHGLNALTAPKIEGLRAYFLEGPYLDISATQIRSELAAGSFVGKGLPKPVFQYIQTKKLYGYLSN